MSQYLNVSFCITSEYITYLFNRYNNSYSSNNPAGDLDYLLTYQTIIFSLLLIVGIPANVFVIFIILKQKDSLTSLTNCLLISLATADLISYVTGVPVCLLATYGVVHRNSFTCK